MIELKNLCSYNLLFVEDDAEVRTNISNIFSTFFKKVFRVSSTNEALDIYKNNKIDVVYTDINMVGTNGLDLIKIIRQENSNIPIVITSACTDTDYLLDAIPLGLIDYLVKPISYEVLKNSLLKCLEVLIRAKDNIILFKNGKMYNFETNLLLDSSSKIIKLQYKEKLLLNLLIENQNKTTSYYQIEEYIWEGMELNKGTLKVLIVKLRKKIGKDTIITENGLGYRLVL